MRVLCIYECQNCSERFEEEKFNYSVEVLLDASVTAVVPHKCGNGFIGVGKCVAIKEMDREYAIQNS